jgi:hypothetical protein
MAGKAWRARQFENRAAARGGNDRSGKAVTYRIGQKYSTHDWQIKQSPGWKIVFRGADLSACAHWFRDHAPDINLADVPVLTSGYPWRSLQQHLENKP